MTFSLTAGKTQELNNLDMNFNNVLLLNMLEVQSGKLYSKFMSSSFDDLFNSDHHL